MSKLSFKKVEFELLDTIVRLNFPYSVVCDVQVLESKQVVVNFML